MQKNLWWVTWLALAACKAAEAPPSAPAKAPASEAKKQDEVPGSPPPEATTTSSGLAYQVLKPGAGDERPTLHDRVRVEFLGWSTKGPFDSSKKSGGTEVFEVKGVISGWTEALLEMRVGERRRLWLPDKLAYPNLRAHPTIWVFEVELLEILRGKAPPPAPSEVAVAPADAIKTGSGLAYKLITTGEGDDKPKAWDRVKLRYTGWGKDGAVIEDSSGVFELAKLMPGWREALQLVAAGDRVRVWLPAALAQPKHKDNTLYELELLSVEHMAEPPRALTPPTDALTTKSGLSYRWNTRGERGPKPTLHDRVVMTYNAWISDGELFDSSTFRGKPSSYPMRGLIPGWAEGLQLMSPGDKATFWIPEPLAYQGREGAPQGTLIYEVELHDILSREGSSTHP